MRDLITHDNIFYFKQKLLYYFNIFIKDVTCGCYFINEEFTIESHKVPLIVTWPI